MENEKNKYGEKLRNKDYPIGRISDLRDAFWKAHPEFAKHRKPGKRQNEYNTDIRIAWVDYVERMHRNKQISNKIAHRAIL